MQHSDHVFTDKQSTGLMLILTIATAGIYPFLWLIKNLDAINSFSAKKVSFNSILILSAIWMWSNMVSQAAPAFEDEETLLAIIGFLNLGLNILLIVLIYTTITKEFLEGLSLKILEDEKIDVRVNQFFAFLFGYFYMNYKANELTELRARQKILNS